MADETSKSFWATVPGILTGAATLITAIVGLLAALNRPEAKPEPPPIVTEAPAPIEPQPIQPVAPQPTVNPVPDRVYTDRCSIQGEPLLITSTHLVLSQARDMMQVGTRVPPLHPDCLFDMVSVNGARYCVQTGTGDVYIGNPIPVGKCWPCPGGVCG
ncbi:MAG: hypothetical protein ACRD2T_08445 [Thermoanaerobaculia bacterium]